VNSAKSSFLLHNKSKTIEKQVGDVADEKQIDKDQVKKDYFNGMKYKDLASKYGVSINTVKSWVKRYAWAKEKGTHKNSKGCTQSKNEGAHKIKSAHERENKIKKEAAEEIKEVLENNDLNDKQRFFCIIYAKRQNATKAYQKAYKCTYETAMVEGCKSLKKPKIKEQINKLLESELNKEFLKKGLIQQYKDIAFSDIGDYLEFGKKRILQWTKDKDGKDVPVIDPNTGEQKINEYSYIDLKDSVCLDTSLITEVSEGKDGIKFKLADKMKAMDVLSKLSNLLSDEEKTKLDLEYRRLQNVKLQVDIEKAKNDNMDDDIEYDIDGDTDENKEED
jgi:phage terminase small subunit